MSIQIHGKEYVTVAERLTEAREDIISINTEVVQHPNDVIIKATVVTKKGTFTGISAANTNKTIEKMSPYEVAETSAVGRALGFAGYGAVESIATADEMVKANVTNIESLPQDLNQAPKGAVSIGVQKVVGQTCKDCEVGKYVLNPKTNNIFCENKCWLKEPTSSAIPF